MVDWLGERLDKDPARTLPLIGMDLNDGLGMVKKEGIVYYTTGEEVGMHGNAEEKYQGVLLRKLMEKHHLLAVKTVSDLPPTYHGWDGPTSHIDRILLPKGS